MTVAQPARFVLELGRSSTTTGLAGTVVIPGVAVIGDAPTLQLGG